MLWSIREIESLNELGGIKKIAFIIPKANEPLVNLSYIFAAVAKSPMQVRMFGTQAAAENWLKEMS